MKAILKRTFIPAAFELFTALELFLQMKPYEDSQ